MALFEELIFLPARKELLVYHEEREGVIRTCRDINSYSKKLIFSCHRNDFNQIDGYLVILATKFKKLGELSDSVYFPSYKSTISNCIEEFIEGITFFYYLKQKKILQFNQLLNVIENLLNDEKEVFKFFNSNYSCPILAQADYFMGLFDLTGEIMRYSISNDLDILHLDTLTLFNGEFNKLFSMHPHLTVQRGSFSLDGGGVGKKLDTFKQSWAKVRDAVCEKVIMTEGTD